MAMILIVIGVLLTVFGLRLYLWSREITEYNEGWCTTCQGSKLRYAYGDPQSGKRWYKCETCDRTVKLSYKPVDGG